MELSEVLEFSGITAPQKEAIKRYYKASHTKSFKSIKDREDFKARIAGIIKIQENNNKKKALKAEKFGSFNDFNDFLKRLMKEDSYWTYKKFAEIINEATAERQEGLAKRRELEAKLAELDAQYGFETKKKK